MSDALRTRKGKQLIQRVAIFASVLLTACTTVGPDFTKPEPALSGEWMDSTDPTVNTDSAEDKTWWLVFEDPILNNLVSQASTQNLTLQVAGLRILEARAQLGIAYGRNFPQVQQANGSVAWIKKNKNSDSAGDLDFTNSSLSFDANWELDIWGRFRRGVESADASYLSSVASYDDALVTLTAEVARNYSAMRTFEERLVISRENVDIQEQSVKIAEARFRFGSTTELDTKQAQTLLYSTLATIPEIQFNIRRLRNAIAVLLGITPNHVDAIIGGSGPIPIVPDSVTVGIPAELLRRRPDIRQAELNAAAQSALIGVARSDLYPSFYLFGSIGLESTSNNAADDSGIFSSDAVFFNGGPGFSWNILNYGRIKNAVRVQDARFQQTLVNYQNVVLEAVREAEDAITGYISTREQLGHLKNSVAASQRAVDIALLQYQEGAADYTRVLNTQEALFREQEREVTSRGSAVESVISLYKALGGGWQVRIGDEIIPAETREQMAERTNWGSLLETRTGPAMDSEEARKSRRKVEW